MDLDKETLILSDDRIFFTIEGEGEYVGQRSLFMRMAMCNLTCSGFTSPDSPHGCDSYISWSVKNKMTFNEIFTLMEENNWIEKLKMDTIWKLTGGEPLIQQKQLLKLVEAFVERYDFLPKIDFETNATIQPSAKWRAGNIKATFTTSPKLSSNGDPLGKRYIPEVLDWHATYNSGFKFVIKNQTDIDVVITNYVDKFDIPPSRVWLMPCCGSRQEHAEVSSMVAELAKKYYFNFSPRLQLDIWDKALKV